MDTTTEIFPAEKLYIHNFKIRIFEKGKISACPLDEPLEKSF